jgi:hypothetical protein
MSPSPQLHPSVRERHEPRISTTALAEYLIMHADDQERILHDARFSTAPIVTANGDAMRALRAYNVDVRRDKSALDMVKAALTRKSLDVNERPKSRDEAKRCCEAIDLFERNENALGMRRLSLATPPRFEALLVEGVSLSVRPDFIVQGIAWGPVFCVLRRLPIRTHANLKTLGNDGASIAGKWLDTCSRCFNCSSKTRAKSWVCRTGTCVSSPTSG